MFCLKCGKKLKNNKNICNSCKQNTISNNKYSNFFTSFDGIFLFIQWRKFKKLYLILIFLVSLLLSIRLVNVDIPVSRACDEINMKFIPKSKAYVFEKIDKNNFFETRAEAVRNCKKTQSEYYSQQQFDFIGYFFDDIYDLFTLSDNKNKDIALSDENSTSDKVVDNFVCGTDSLNYGEIKYDTAQIGEQCWMKNNLNIGNRIQGKSEQKNNGAIEKYCYNDSDDGCAVYGGLYQWNEAVMYGQSNLQGICPDDWHIPSSADWSTLIKYMEKMPISKDEIVSVMRSSRGSFNKWNVEAYYLENNDGTASMVTYDHYGPPQIQPTGLDDRYAGYLVRCIKD